MRGSETFRHMELVRFVEQKQICYTLRKPLFVVNTLQQEWRFLAVRQAWHTSKEIFLCSFDNGFGEDDEQLSSSFIPSSITAISAESVNPIVEETS